MKFKKNVLKWIGITIITLVILPLLTQILINWDTTNQGSDDGWLGFWGGYLGSIVGVIGAVYIFNNQMKKDSETRRSEITDNTFFNLLTLHTEQHGRLIENGTFNKITDDQKSCIVKEISDEGIEYFYSQKYMLVPLVEEIQKNIPVYISREEIKLSPGDTFYERWQRVKNGESFNDSYSTSDVSIIYNNLCFAQSSTEYLTVFLSEVNSGNLTEWASPYQNGIIDKLKKIKGGTYLIDQNSSGTLYKRINDFYGIIMSFNKDNYKMLSFHRRKKAIELSISKNYSDIGSFLRTFHRIVKYINENVTDEELKKNYIGFLRASLNETEILVIFYNAVYTKKGKGLLNQLKQTTFFGEKEEFDEIDAPPFVSRKNLYFEEDFEYMKSLNKASELWK